MIEPTNTLACANFDVLKIDGVEDPYINVSKLATLDMEESYFAKCVKFVNECNIELANNKTHLYKAISEAAGDHVILESFAGFFASVREIIKKFIKFLNKLVDKFVISMMQLVKSDKYILKHKDALHKISGSFYFNGFNYTFTPTVPMPEAALSYNNSLFDDLFVNNSNRVLDTNSVKESIAAMDLEKDLDQFRARVIGKENETIYITDFADELFKVYRDGKSDTEEIEAVYSYVIMCLNRFINYNKMEKEITSQKNNTIKAYELVEKQVKEISKRNNDLDKSAFLSQLPSDIGVKDIQTTAGGTKMAAELMAQIDVYVNAKINQIQEYSNIHLLAFGAKLTALQECLNQDRNVLYRALRRLDAPINDRKGGSK